MSADDQPTIDHSVTSEEILHILIEHDLVTRTAGEEFERQPENVKVAIEQIQKAINREVAGKLQEKAEQWYFYEGDGSQLDSDKIVAEVAAHMSQTGKGFRPNHSNAHLIAAMSLALDWVAEATARELPTAKNIAKLARTFGKNRQGH